MKAREISILGIRQNCYRRDVDPLYTCPRKHDDTIKTYVSLERKHLPNGFVEQLEVKDYPINSESITSYADGADYRRDPAAAVANAPKRVNLGDITEVQNFLKSEPQQAVRVYRDVLAQLVKIDKDLGQKQKEEPVQEPAQGGEG